MSERYWVTGVQLGTLQSLIDEDLRKMLVDEIIDGQFIGNYRTEEEQKDFKKRMSKFQ